jgi:hypothetical protein
MSDYDASQINYLKLAIRQIRDAQTSLCYLKLSTSPTFYKLTACRQTLAGLYKLANAFCSPPPFLCRPKMPDPPKASVNRASVALACFC